MSTRRQKPWSAFTLLEIMISIALLAMVVVAIYASWNSILKGSKVALNAAANAQRSRITMRTIHDALLCACMFNAGGSNYYFLGTSEGEDSSLSFVAHLPKSFLRHGKFGDLNVRRVSFTVESGSDSHKQLVMRQRPLIMDFDKDETQYPLVLATDVSQFKIEYLDPKTGDRVTEWDQTNQLPREVYITIALGHKDQFSSQPEDTLFSIVALPANAVRVEWQAPMGGQPVNNNRANGANGTANGANGANGTQGGGAINRPTIPLPQ